MGYRFSRPLTDAQLKARAAKEAERREQERKDEQELIIAYLLEKVSAKETTTNDDN